jgi:hypothetical protein
LERPLSSSTNGDDALFWNVYTSVRNIRCWCRSRLLAMSNNASSVAAISLPKPTQAAAVVVIVPCCPWLWTDLRDALSYLDETTSHESSSLEAIAIPARSLLEQHGPAVERRFAGAAVVTTAAEPSSDNYKDFECLVQCMIACDTVYYQLYYAQLTHTAAAAAAAAIGWGTERHRTVPLHNAIPHPVTYFGEWDDSDTSDEQNGTTPPTQNALAALHHLRQAETATIFQDWMQRYPKVTASLDNWWKSARSDNSLDALHATLAPPLLSAWRDSCRDFLCHLYSYATITNANLWTMCDTLITRHDCTRILEVGAGTGYLAHSLTLALPPHHASFQTSGPWITATDAVPDANNEYHAATPAFVDHMHRGDSTRSKFWSQPFVSLRSGSAGLSHTALLLCYPPPQSSMAVQTVRHFFEQCQGRILIHIGEFKGLTGDAAFEQYLITHCHCLPQRWPCLSWGTDAAHVTIWERKKQDPVLPTTWQGKQSFAARQEQSPANTARSLLLPCVQCGVHESIRRCRFLRSLTYCSKKCCLAHAMVRREALARAILDVSALPVLLDCDNPQHYSTLHRLY